MRLTIPAGALAASERITVRRITSQDLGPEFAGMTVTRAYELGPDGLSFAAPISVTLRSDQVPRRIRDTVGLVSEALATSLNGTLEPLDSITVTMEGDTVVIGGQLNHFSSLVQGVLDVVKLPRVSAFAVVPETVPVGVPFNVTVTLDVNDIPGRILSADYLNRSAEQLGGAARESYLALPEVTPGRYSATLPYTCSTAGTWLYAGSVAAGLVFGLPEEHYPVPIIFRLQRDVTCETMSLLSISVVGQGTVTSSPPGIVCDQTMPDTCEARFRLEQIRLDAVPASGWKLDQWSGDVAGCEGNGASIFIDIPPTDPECEATFVPDTPTTFHALSVDTGGTGHGNIKSAPAAIDCGNGGLICQAQFTANALVELTAAPASGSAFAGWALDCVDAGTALVVQLLMSQPRACRAVFNLAQNLGLIPRGFLPLQYRADGGVHHNPLFVASEDAAHTVGRLDGINIDAPDNLALLPGSGGQFCPRVRSLYIQTPAGGGDPMIFGLSFDHRNSCFTFLPLGQAIGVIPTLGFAPGWGKQVNATFTAIADFEFSGVLLNRIAGGNSPFVPVVPQGERACLFELDTDPAGSTVFVVGREGVAGTSTEGCNNHRTLYRIDVAGATVTGSAALGAMPRGIAISSDGAKVYVADFANDLVQVFDNGASLTFNRSIPAGDGPTGLALTPDNNRLLVTNWNSNRIQLIDLTTNQEIASADSRGPHPVRVFVVGTNAFVLNYGDEASDTDGSVAAYGLP